MSKKIELIRNSAGGVDLLTERDAGNEIRILTGKPERSREFWKRMIETAEIALSHLEEEAETE